MWRACFDHFLICLSSLTSAMVCSSLAPLLPLQVHKRGLNSLYSNTIYYFYSFGLIAAPCFISKCLLPRCGKLYSAQSMFLVQAVAVICFGLVQYIPNDAPFIASSMLSLFFVGFSESVIVTSALMMSSIYFNGKSSYQTAFMMGYQLSELIGPVWGGLFYNHLGYSGIFLAQAAILLLSSALLCYFRSLEGAHPNMESNGSNIRFCQLLRVPGVVFGFLVFMCAESFYMSINPILPVKLARQFGFGEHRVGLFFLNFTAIMAIVTLALLFVPNKVRKTLFILIGNFIIVAGCFLVGPSKLFGLPNTLKIMKLGMWIAGAGRALMQSFSSGYMEKYGNQAFPGRDHQVSAKIGMMLNYGQAFSILVIQLVISFTYKQLGFNHALELLALLYLLNAISFTIHSIFAKKK